MSKKHSAWKKIKIKRKNIKPNKLPTLPINVNYGMDLRGTQS